MAAGEQTFDTFTYTVSDGNGGTDTATVTITIDGVNDAPMAVDDLASTDEDTMVDINMLSNDSDPDTSDSLSVISVDADDMTGGLIDRGGGVYGYDPTELFEELAVGEQAFDTFSYVVGDGTLTDTATVTITVNGVNDAPTAVDDPVNVLEDTTVEINVLGNDSDIDTSDVLSIGAVGALDQGGSAVNGGTVITYTPATDFVGTETFTYTVTDGNGGTDTAIVTVEVGKDTMPGLEPASQSETTPFAIQVYTLTLTNNGLAADTFSFSHVATDTSALPPGDEWNVLMPANPTLDAGQSIMLQVTVEIPANETNWVTHTLTLTATSQNLSIVVTTTLTTWTGGEWDDVDGRWEGCRFDMVSDGIIELRDWLEMKDQYGGVSPLHDFNHDGLVELRDLLFVKYSYGSNCSGP